MPQTLQAFEKLDPHVVFQGLTAAVGLVAPMCMGVASVILITGHVMETREARISHHHELQTDIWIKTLFIFGMMLFSNWFLVGMATAGDEMAEKTGLGGPMDVAVRCVVVAMSFPELDGQVDLTPPPAQAQPGQPAPSGFWATVAAKAKAAGQWVWDTTKRMALNVVQVALVAETFWVKVKKFLIVVPAMFSLITVLLASAAVTWFFTALRYFLIVMGSTLLPIAIACYRTKTLHNMGHNYVMQMVSVCLWPFGWALGHCGTVALFNTWVGMLSGSTQLGYWTNAMTWNNIMTQGVNFRTAANAGVTVASITPVGLLLTFVFGGIALCVWILIVTFGAPKMISKVVMSGNAFYSAMTAQVVSKTAGVAGQMVSAGGQAVQLVGTMTGNPVLAGAGSAIAGAGKHVGEFGGALGGAMDEGHGGGGGAGGGGGIFETAFSGVQTGMQVSKEQDARAGQEASSKSQQDFQKQQTELLSRIASSLGGGGGAA